MIATLVKFHSVRQQDSHTMQSRMFQDSKARLVMITSTLTLRASIKWRTA